jgi:hypothetical protein
MAAGGAGVGDLHERRGFIYRWQQLLQPRIDNIHVPPLEAPDGYWW